MAYQAVFRRYELKYLLSAQQKAAVLEALSGHMQPDRYGRVCIRNIYFDTDSYRLIRHSIEKPAYKEKLRIRSYSPAGAQDTVFVELKKKYDGLVYKRRLALPLDTALGWLQGSLPCPTDTQIGREIEYFRSFYGSLRPKVLLTYERVAYFSDTQPDFRVTFDDNIQARQEQLQLDGSPEGQALLPEGMTLMEIKCAGGIPLWLTRVLTEKKIYKTSFSKYGTAYCSYIYPKNQEVATYGQSF